MTAQDLFDKQPTAPPESRGADFGKLAPQENGQIVAAFNVGELDRASVDIQVSTAKRYPRNVHESLQRARDLACYSPEIAAACSYALPRDNKIITGPGVRLAEMWFGSWGNIRCRTTILGADDKVVTCQAEAWDLETNAARSRQAQRPIVDRNGRRFKEHMIVTTAMACQAIAGRDAVFDVIPKVYVFAVQQEAQRLARGESEGLEARRKKAMDFFASHNIEPERVFDRLGVAGIEDITWGHVDIMLACAQSLIQQELTPDQLFPPLADEPTGDGRIGFGKKAGEPAKPPEAEPEKPKRQRGRPKGSRNKPKTGPKPQRAPEPEAQPEPAPQEEAPAEQPAQAGAPQEPQAAPEGQDPGWMTPESSEAPKADPGPAEPPQEAAPEPAGDDVNF